MVVPLKVNFIISNNIPPEVDNTLITWISELIIDSLFKVINFSKIQKKNGMMVSAQRGKS